MAPVRLGGMTPVQPFDGPSSRFSGGEASPRSQLTGPQITGTPVEMPSSRRAAVTGRVVRTSGARLSSEPPVEQMRAAEQTQRLTPAAASAPSSSRHASSPFAERGETASTWSGSEVRRGEHHRIAGRVVLGDRRRRPVVVAPALVEEVAHGADVLHRVAGAPAATMGGRGGSGSGGRTGACARGRGCARRSTSLPGGSRGTMVAAAPRRPDHPHVRNRAGHRRNELPSSVERPRRR